ncbi:apolipoprotein A-IV [Cololabis saira]|uniref:apolipoprotein A-IV n=1 Tax=Cololabis saira TaxID=129043 RepID=UPI002AD4F201|nr:apolipoprotein A-IV [Cololabis saira]
MFSWSVAYPLRGDTREATWFDSKGNQAHDKTDLAKNVDKLYKSIIDKSDLYNHESDDTLNPVAEEMKHKLTMESERLRVRLQQELAELRERLSPSPAQLSATLASMRERLNPLTQQLQSSVSSNTQGLCSQLKLYLQGMETAVAQAEASPTFYQEVFHWISQTLRHSSLQLANMINEFHTTASGVIEHLKQTSDPEGEAADSKVWQEMSSRLGHEVSLLKEEAENRVGALQAQLAALLESAQPREAEVAGTMEQFCQSAAEQSQELQGRMERVLVAVEEEVRGASVLSLPSSWSTDQGGSLQGDFSVKLSALIQDILHSVR